MRALALLVVASLSACGGGGEGAAPDAGPPADAAPWIQNGPCAMNTRAGDLHVDHSAVAVDGAFSGVVREGLDPADILTPREADGACQLFRRERYLCPLPCPGSQTCDGTMCIPRKLNLSAGTITVTGLAVPISAEPSGITDYSMTGLPNPPFAPGDRITLTAEGDEVPGFTLRATGVSPLTVPADEWTVVRGQPFTVDWDTTGTGDSSMFITLNIDQHGNTPILMFCEVPDTGSYTISAGLIQTWVDYGVTGVPNISFVRHSSDSLQQAVGCIEFAARSIATKVIAVEGHTPCLTTAQCTPPQICDVPTETCVDP